MEKTTLSRSEKLDRIFGTPVYAVLLAILILCVVAALLYWGISSLEKVCGQKRDQ